MLTMVVVFVIVIVQSRGDDNEKSSSPSTLHAVAPILEPGLPVLSLLQRAGEPACRVTTDDGQLWLYPRQRAVGQGCTPMEGDLVVIVEGERVARFTPEYGRTAEVIGPSDVAAFRARYSSAGARRR